MLLLQALQSPFRIYLYVIIKLYIFSDGIIYTNILEHFNLMLITRLILFEISYFRLNEP